MKIVVLDGYTLNPGDLSWDSLKALGECEIYNRSTVEETVSRAGGARIVLTNKTTINRAQMDALPDMKYIGVLATGYNVVDVGAATDHHIIVTNIPSYGTDSVAQMTFAHILNLTHHVADHAKSVHGGQWTRCPDFCYWESPLVELYGLTLGIIGIGRIGQAVSRIARSFDMHVMAYDVVLPDPLPDDVEMVSLVDLLHDSDIISLHCPLTEYNERLINCERLFMMKKTAFLINTSRGALVDEKALADALNRNEIAGAGLDTLSTEPPSASNPLLHAKNCHITPHHAWATRAARQRLLDMAVENVRSFISGTPVNVVHARKNQ